MGSKLYGAEGRGDVLNFQPEALKVITDTKHPQYDPRVERAVDEAMVLSIMRQGVILPLVINRDGDDVYVVDGRQRRACAIEANKRLAKAGGDPVLVPCVWRRGDDAKLFEVMVTANELRSADSPLDRAKKMQRLADMGRDEEQLAIVFGVKESTVRATLALLDCAPAVQSAIAGGEVPAGVATKLSKLPRAEQTKKLEEMRAAGATRGKAAKKALKGERTTAARRMRSRAVVERFMAGLEQCRRETQVGDAVHLALLWVLGHDEAFEEGGVGYAEVKAAATAAVAS